MVQDTTLTPVTLTPRQSEVLELLRLGLTNGEIAQRLGISTRGAEWHVSEVIGRLGVRNRYEAAHWPERAPWWAAALSPVGLFWRRAGAALPFKASSAASATAGAAFLTTMAGLGLIAVLVLLGDGDGVEPIAVAGAPPTAGPPGEVVSLDVPGGGTPEPPAPANERDASSGAGQPLVAAAPAEQQTPDVTPTPCPTVACVPSPDETPAAVGAPTPVPAPFGNGAMAVDCDAETEGIQTACSYASGETFWAQVHLVYPPEGGFDGIQARLRWTDDVLNYLPGSNNEAATLWPGCDVPAGHDYQLEAEPSVLFGCVSWPGLPSAPAIRGPIFQAQFKCRYDGATDIELPTAAPLGDNNTHFARAASPDWITLPPAAVTGANVTCGPCATTLCAVPADDGGVLAVDCDAEADGIQDRCWYPTGAIFHVQVHVSRPPSAGYVYLRAMPRWTGLMRPWWSDPGRALLDACTEDWGDDLGLLSCNFVAPDRASNFRGAVWEFRLRCLFGDGLVSLPQRQANGYGTYFVDGAMDTLDPVTAQARVTCGSPADAPAAGAMALDCDGGVAGVQSSCIYPSDATFNVELHVTQPPSGGYGGFAGGLDWTSTVLHYVPGSGQVLWEDCADPVAGRLADPDDPHPPLGVACYTNVLEQESTFTGAVFEFEVRCEDTGTTPLRLRAQFIPDLFGLEPALTPTQITCVAPTGTPTPTPAPGP